MASKKICICESADRSERARIDCYARNYQAFLHARGRGHKFDADVFANCRHVHEIRCDIISFDSVTEELVETLILQQFIRNYADTHPRFVYDMPPLNFKSKVDFFSGL